jgi:tetratricopeptide (TPR) repeat protein
MRALRPEARATSQDGGVMIGSTPGPLGRHGTARPEPWHARWLELRPALKTVGELERARRVGDEVRIGVLADRLAADLGLSSYATPDLDERERGLWLVRIIQGAATALRDQVTVPLPEHAASEQAILFWHLALGEGDTPGRIGRNLPKYVSGVTTKDPKQWVTSRIWMSGLRPNARAGPGLAELTRQIDLRLAAAAPHVVATEATTTLVRETLDRLLLEDPASASWMAVLAHFAPHPIPVAPLQAEVSITLPHVKGRLDQRPLSHYVERLVSLGLLNRIDQGTFEVPPPVSAAVLAYLENGLRTKAVWAAVELLGRAFDEDCHEQQRWQVSDALAPHVLSVAAAAESTPGGSREAGPLLRRVATYYRARAWLDESIEVGRRAVTATERAYGSSSPVLAEPLVNLARALKDRGNHPEAEALFVRAIELEADESTPALTRAQTWNLYGNLLRGMRRLRRAESAHHKALSLFGP